MKKAIKIILLIFLLNFCFVLFPDKPAIGAGATLFLSPSGGTYTVGKSFTVKVMVNSGGGDGINAAEGVINYDLSYLTVSSVSETGSIFKLWTTNPTYSNSSGKIIFGGGSPGAYTGNAGKIFSVTFSSKKAGETQVSFSSGIVLAADGKGTNVFEGFGNAKYILSKAEEEPKKKKEEAKKEEPKTKGILPPLPEISSHTHPKENVWYADNEPEFSWKILSDLTGVSFIITESLESNPGPSSDGVIESKKFEAIKDGEWYFHIKYQNKFGWGQIAHQKFLVDSTPPESFKIILDNEGDVTNPSPKLKFRTADSASGIDYYNIKINEKSVRAAPAEVSQGYYRPEPLLPGEYKTSVAAFDRAQNVASSSISFIVDPLRAPIITSIPKTINKKDELIIQGTSFYPRVIVKIYISQKGQEAKEASVQTDDEGNWSYFHKVGLGKGTYEVWAKLIDSRGAQSLNSARHLLIVESLSIIEGYGLFIIIALLAVIILLILFILYQRKKCAEEKARIKRETEELKSKLSKIFAALREEVDELIELADKKTGLSESERRVKEKLQESLDISEEFISKEIEDVEKEIKLKKNNNENK